MFGATKSVVCVGNVRLYTFFFFFFFFNDTATTEIYTLSLHDALPISLLESMRFGLRCCLAVAAGEGAGIGAPEELW